MEYSIDAVANKLLVVIAALSLAICVAAYLFFAYAAGISEATSGWRTFGTIMGVNTNTTVSADIFPFAAGVLASVVINFSKVILMKRAVNSAMQRDALQAKLYLQGQYFLRLVITGVVLLAAGWLHSSARNEAGNPDIINFMGAFFGIFTFPIAMYSMRIFLKDELKDNEIIESAKETENTTVKDTLEQLNAIGAEEEPAADDKAE